MPKRRLDEDELLVEEEKSEETILYFAHPDIPEDRLILEGIDTTREPRFSVSEVAKFFFRCNTHWVRWAERKGYFILDGETVGKGRTEAGSRVYSLGDVEKMAHALAAKEIIDHRRLSHVLHLVLHEAKLWSYID